MPVEIIECQQGTEAWYAARVGIATASKFSDVLAKGEGKMRRALLYRLAGEIITGKPGDSYRNANMDRGNEMEEEARLFYALKMDVEPQLVGFVKNQAAKGPVGWSPDSLIRDDGALEIKTCQPSVLVEYLMKAQADPEWYPPEHRAQCQGGLWVGERQWIDLLCYWPGMPPLLRRIERDEAFIRELAVGVSAFHTDLDEVVGKIRSFGA